MPQERGFSSLLQVPSLGRVALDRAVFAFGLRRILHEPSGGVSQATQQRNTISRSSGDLVRNRKAQAQRVAPGPSAERINHRGEENSARTPYHRVKRSLCVSRILPTTVSIVNTDSDSRDGDRRKLGEQHKDEHSCRRRRTRIRHMARRPSVALPGSGLVPRSQPSLLVRSLSLRKVSFPFQQASSPRPIQRAALLPLW